MLALVVLVLSPALVVWAVLRRESNARIQLEKALLHELKALNAALRLDALARQTRQELFEAALRLNEGDPREE